MSENIYEFGAGTKNTSDSDDHVTNSDTTTILDQMREEIAHGVDIEDISLVVPERPNFELLFHPNIEYDLLNSMMKKARKSVGGGKKEWHPLAFAYAVMSHATVGVVYKGKIVQDSNGDDITILSPAFHELFNARSMQQALNSLYIKEGHIISSAQKIVDESGYGDIDVESGSGAGDPLDQ